MFGSLVEEAFDRCLYFRSLAFARAATYDEPLAALKFVDPISGISDAANGDHLTAHLAGWGHISGSVWKLRPPRAFPADGFELNGDALAGLPALAKGNFGH